MQEDFFTRYKFGILQKIPRLRREDFERYGFLTEDHKIIFDGQLHHEGFRAFNKERTFTLISENPCLLKGEYIHVWSYIHSDEYHGLPNDIVSDFNRKHSGNYMMPDHFEPLPAIHIEDLSEISDDYEVLDEHFDCGDEPTISISFSDYAIDGTGSTHDFSWYYPTYRNKETNHALTIVSVITILERFFGIQHSSLDQFL